MREIWNSFKLKMSMVMLEFKVRMKDKCKNKGGELGESWIMRISRC